ncbi:MAG: hypothetical protein ACYSUH_09940, partial [Planctomycetota bacterium]
MKRWKKTRTREKKDALPAVAGWMLSRRLPRRSIVWMSSGSLIFVSTTSLYILDESSDILHLEKNNHSFLINNIVSLNQNPPSPMVAAVRSKELLVIDDVESHKTPNIHNTKRFFS